MSKSTKTLASASLGDVEAEKEIVVTTEVVPFEPGVTRVVYSPNRTDQLHGLSVAEMVRNGQSALPIDDVNNFDYIDEVNKPFKDDGSLEIHSMNDVEWADPAEIYERSQALEENIRNSIKVVVDTDKLDSQKKESSKESKESSKESFLEEPTTTQTTSGS